MDDVKNGEQGMQLAMRGTEIALHTACQIAQIILMTTKKLETNPYYKQVNKEIESGNTSILQCDTEDFDALVKGLRESGTRVLLTGVAERQPYIMILKEDQELAQGVVDQYYTARDRCEVTPKEMLILRGDEKSKEFVIGSEEEASLVRNRCIENNIHVNIKPGWHDFRVRYLEKDEPVVNRIKASVAYDVSGKLGEIYKDQIDWENKEKCTILNNAINRVFADDTHIVSKDNDCEITLNKYKVTITKDGVSETISAADKEYENKIKVAMYQMNNVVALNSEQYQQYKLVPEKKDFLLDIERMNGRHVLTEDEMAIVLKAEKERQLIEQKLMQDHPDGDAAFASDYNTEQPLAFFKEAEKMNFEATHDMGEIVYADAVLLDDARARNFGYSDKDMRISLENEVELEGLHDLAREMMETMPVIELDESIIDKSDVVEPELN